MPDRGSALQSLFLKLSSIGHLGEEDRQVLDTLPIHLQTYHSEQDIAHEGGRPKHCCILLSGWTCRHKTFVDGERQILSLNLAGDLIDLQSLDMPVMDHTITALTEVQVACVPHAAMRNLLMQSASLNSILWRAALIEAAVTRQWLLNVGQRSAQERIAHLICELFMRLHGIGLAHTMGTRSSFTWPLTQLRLAQATGLSAVHVNRSLQELRARGLIELKSNYMTVLDWPGLVGLGEFDPAYLALMPETQAAA